MFLQKAVGPDSICHQDVETHTRSTGNLPEAPTPSVSPVSPCAHVERFQHLTGTLCGILGGRVCFAIMDTHRCKYKLDIDTHQCQALFVSDVAMLHTGGFRKQGTLI